MSTKKIQILTTLVTSVNGKSGDIVLSPDDVGALPDTTTYVTSVNGKSGDIVLSPDDVGALPDTTTYVTSVNGKSGKITVQATITGAATTITNNNLEKGKVLVSDSNGKVAASTITVAEINEAKTIASGKADKMVPAKVGNLACLDAKGNLADSGAKVSDFAASSHTHDNYCTNSDINTKLNGVIKIASWDGTNLYLQG